MNSKQLLEKKIRDMVYNSLNENIYYINEAGRKGVNHGALLDKIRNDIAGHIVKKYNTGDQETRDRIESHANRSNIDLSSLNKRLDLHKKKYPKDATFDNERLGVKSTREPNINTSSAQDIKNYVIDGVEKLRSGIITDNSSFNANFQERLKKYDNDPEAIEIFRQKEFIDKMGLTFLYDKNYYPADDNDWGYGFTPENTPKGRLLTIDEIEQIFDPSLGLLKYQKNNEEKIKKGEDPLSVNLARILERYLDSKYGMDFSVPTISTGNRKVQNTLVINFASAHGCPAWNECLVKHACYARSDERSNDKNRGGHGQWKSNEKRQFLWLTSMNDPELEALLNKYARVTALRFGALYNNMTDKGIFTGTFEELADLPFSQWTEEMVAEADGVTIEKNETVPIKLVKQIRFNENGDFLNQNILEMAERLAKDFSFIGITASAYTCRHLNYDGIETIILNASQENLNLDVNGQGNSIFARIFLATPSELYSTIPDTWAQSDGILGRNPIYTTWEKYKDGVLVKKESHAIYKCPCGKKLFGSKEDTKCHECNICYEKKDSSVDRFYVLVEAHGDAKDQLDVKRTDDIVKSIGKPNIELGRPLEKELYDNWNRTGYLKFVLHEDVGGSEGTPLDGLDLKKGIGCICNNAIWSMNKVFGDLGVQNQIRMEAKEKFKTILENITKIK